MRFLSCYLIIFFSSLVLTKSIWAGLDEPVRTISEVSGKAIRTPVRRVKTARILMADYALIKKDFPSTSHLTNIEIDAWLLQYAGYISTSQATQGVANHTNTPIEAGENAHAYRPPDYKRALVFQTPDGLLDGKGFGAPSPGLRSHSNGLMETAEAIREYAFSKIVSASLEHSHAEFGVVDAYAVIDWGFDQFDLGGSDARPSGAVLRQAHRRSEGKYSLLADDRVTRVERILRQYGITSAGAHRETYGLELMNIQGTFDESHILDFGGFRVVKKFEYRVVPFFNHSTTVMDPSDLAFPQPLSEYRVPFEVWGSENPGVHFPQEDELIWKKSRELAENFRRDPENTVKKIIEFKEKFIDHWVEHLRKNPFRGTVDE